VRGGDREDRKRAEVKVAMRNRMKWEKESKMENI